MAVEFTESQRSAIESRGCSLIVSAAAGSGKTAVLVERVIGLICDPDSPASIDRLLVVTFTNAAASEMRAKISKAVMEKLSREPGNIWLRRQLSLLSCARIQTVHAFCLDLVREHFSECGVPADFAVADQARASELRAQAMEDALEELYIENDGDFAALCEALAEEKGDRVLESVIDDVFDKLSSHIDPAASLDRFTSEEGQDSWKAILTSMAGEIMENAAVRLEGSVKIMEDCPAVYDKYMPAFSECLDFAAACMNAFEDSWDAGYRAVHSFANPRLPAVKGEEYADLRTAMQEAKKKFAASVRQICDRIYMLSASESEFGREENLAALRGLRMAVTRYSERYSQIKLKYRLLDFSDLEHYALRLLRTKDGQPTALALQLSEELDEVLVDEYQDTNDIQEAIFRAVTCRCGSSFYVGDVKQSIYRFRMAKPEIFMEKYLSYGDHLHGKTGNMRISLNKNFRSRAEILGACNHVFRAVMSREFGDIDYNDSEALYPGAPYPDDGERVRFEVIDMSDASGDDDSPERAEAEAIFTANEIYRMVETERVTDPFSGQTRHAEYRDFAILLSSFANKSSYFIKELERLDIPVSGAQREFWNSMEILSMMSFLRVLDNRRQDIPLIGLMRSAIFLFTADDLADIRVETPSASFFDALAAYAAAHGGRTAEFLAQIDEYAAYVPDALPSQIISMLYSRYSIPAVFGAMEKGRDRTENLRAFYDLASEYEGSGHRSLFDFIRYAETMMEQGQTPAVDQGDGVRLMSIHRSKGLEFPFVFLPDLNKRFNFDDAQSPAIVHDRLGIGLRIRMRGSHAQYRMPMHIAAAAAIKRELAGEEVRKLYVAMTRAKEKLIMVCGINDAKKHLEDIRSEVELGGITPGWLAGISNAADWILASLADKPCPYISISVEPYDAIGRIEAKKREAPDDRTTAEKPDPELSALLDRRDEEYRYKRLSELPSKLTPAGARRILEDSGVIYKSGGATLVDVYRRKAADSADTGLGGAARGTAIHRFLSVVMPDECADDAAISVRARELAQSGLLTPAEADAIEPAMIRGFWDSRWGRAASSGEYRVLREYEFSAIFSPAELGLDEDGEADILMNGIIDLLIFGPDGLTVIDFKTDSVKPGQEAKAAARHKLQLDIYGMSAEKIFRLPVKEKIVFFLRIGAGVSV